MQYKANPKRKMNVGGSMIEGVKQLETATSGEGECGDGGCGNKRKQRRRNRKRIRKSRG
tara:strand:- start:1147 stop:1323 length:177 start_codon:yes stop_codon:yes gene_type:complete